MKILVLMPCDEQHVHAATKIYEMLPQEIKECTFAMPMFMEYLIETKIVRNWIFSFYDTLISAQHLYEAAEREDEDLIIIGNIPANYKFDIVFNFQDIEQSLSYKDTFIEKIKELVQEDEKLYSMISNLHKANESELALQNCIATADFLTNYIKADATKELKRIEKEYHNALKAEGVDV